MKKTVLMLFLIVSMVIFPATVPAETVRIPVHYCNAADILPTIQSMLSPDGEAVTNSLTNSVIVTDTPETIQRIQNFMPEIDVLGRQIRIHMRFLEHGSSKKRALSAETPMRSSNREISQNKRRKQDLTINLAGRNITKNRTSESFITVISGGSAYISAGKDIPCRERWLLLSRRYTQLVETVIFRRVETGFEVSPVVTGNIAHINIIPRISYVSTDDSKGVIRFTSAQTTVTMQVGQWVSIGGTTREENEVLHTILKYSRDSISTSLDIQLMVEG